MPHCESPAERYFSTRMFITGVGTAAPRTRYTQTQCWEALEASALLPRLAPRSRALLRKVFNGRNGISTRALALDPLTEAFDLTPDTLHARFSKNAPALASAAASQALARARVAPEEIDALVVSTCTGYLCPGLTSYITELLGLRPNVFALDLVGQGCGAAIPNLRTTDALIAAGRARRALSVCVEVCSAALYFDDDPGVLISACLFGDGAGAAVLSSEPSGSASVEWTAAADTCVSPADRNLLRFEQRAGMLRNILTAPVPSLAARYSRKIFESVTAQSGVQAGDISNWIWHAGGRDVLVALRNEFEFANGELAHSEAVLSELGNLSSASVYHVLDRAIAAGPKPGWWWMGAFGAGFSCHGALLRAA